MKQMLKFGYLYDKKDGELGIHPECNMSLLNSSRVQLRTSNFWHYAV